MPQSEQRGIFISYAHRDGAQLAERPHKDLKASRFDVWLDKQRLRGGAVWGKEIEREIDKRQVTVALLTAVPTNRKSVARNSYARCAGASGSSRCWRPHAPTSPSTLRHVNTATSPIRVATTQGSKNLSPISAATSLQRYPKPIGPRESPTSPPHLAWPTTWNGRTSCWPSAIPYHGGPPSARCADCTVRDGWHWQDGAGPGRSPAMRRCSRRFPTASSGS